VFDAYVREIQNADPQSRTNLTIDDFKAALRDQYLRQALTNKIEEQLVLESSFTPSADPSSITTRHILIKVTVPISATEAERDAAYAARKPAAQAILDQLRGGANFAELATAKSDDLSTKNDGGVLPSFDKDGKTSDGSAFDPAFVKAALALKEDEISDLVRTPFGWHIIQVTLRKVDSKEDQLKAARSKAFDEWLQKQRDAAKIEHFPPVTPTPTSPPTPTQEVLPTVPLGGEPTAVPTSTATLSSTGTLPSATLVSTATPGAGTPSAQTLAPATRTSTTIPADTTPAALPPTPIGTPRP
jgi:parvulin-like peptidyl-prolyl cis-trans isomerase-like protein